MIVKSFTADSVAGALKQVRSEMGGEAVILKTRKIDPAQQAAAGGKVEVTACIDQPQAIPKAAPSLIGEPAVAADPAAKIAPDMIAQKLDFLIDVFQSPVRRTTFDGSLSRLFSALMQADMPEAMARDITEQVSHRFDSTDDYSAVATGALRQIQEQLPRKTAPIELVPDRKIVFVGPPGAGKTSLMSRLAGHVIMKKRLPVCLTSLDKIKVSAPEELQSYADILNVDHFEMPSEVDSRIIKEQGSGKVVLIDMPAMNPKNREPLRLFTEKLNRLKPHRVIGVFSALYRSSDLHEIIRAFKPFKVTDLAFTMVDQTDHLGGMIAMSIQTGLPITMLGTGQKAHDINLAPDVTAIIKGCLGLEEEPHHG
jgi:flagellar biosynthesis protein FlhF